MAEAEKKKIADLTFNVKPATDRLDEIDDRFKKLAEDSKKYAETIGKTLNNSISSDKIINVPKIKENLMTVEESVQKYGKNITNTLLKGQNQAEKAEQAKALAAEKSAQRQIESNNRVAKSTESLYDKITQYAKTYVIYQGFNALKKEISETIDEMVKVEQQMVAIDRVMNVTGMDIDGFRDKLIQMAYDYGNSFDNVADVSLRLAQAGIKSENNLRLTEKTLLALNTAELDATQATDDMVAVMSQWNLITNDATQTAEDYGSIIDKVNKVADNFPTTSADILDALKKTSSAFNLAGASIDETIATIVAAEKASQRGGKVIGTALGNITQQLKDAGKVDIAESLGISFFADEAKTQYKPIMEIFQSLSDKMQQLKEEGKESSAEMQQLLSVFTVFRRNIGASLLGEMAGGEESTYQQVIKTIRDSLGYSLEENTKYMNTAKAAQEQFNATLLQLKTEVWDNKVETVYRDLLKGGTDFIKWLENLSKDMKLLPAIIGVVTAGFSLLGKKMDYNSLKKYTVSLKEMQKALEIYNKSTEDGTAKVEKFYRHLGKETPDAVTRYTSSLKGAEASMAGLITNTVLQTVKQVALNLAIAAGEAAISFGLSLAIQGIVTLIGNWIHATENASNALKEMNSNIADGTNTLDTYVDKFTTLRQEMDSGNLTQEEFNKKKAELKDLEEELIKKYGSEAKGINLVTGEIKAQTKAIEELNKADYRKYIQENEKYINQLTKDLNQNITLSLPEMFKTKGGLHSELYDSLYNYLNENFMQMSERTLGDATFFNVKNVGTPEEMINYYRAIYDGLKQYREEIYETLSDDDKKYLDAFIEGVSNTIKNTNDKYSEALEEYEEYLNNKFKYDKFYENEYAKILEARAKVVEASTKGDSEGLQKAQEELNNVYKEAIEKASKDPSVSQGMVKMLEEQIKNANEEIEKEEIGLKIGVQGDELFESIQNILNQMGDIDIKNFKTGLENTDIQTQFGNIDILREGITWNEDNIKKYREQLEELNLDINNLAGSYSNILGASKAFETQAGEIEVAYSPMLKTDHGLIPLYQDEIEEYIQEVLNQAQEDISNGKYSNLNEAVLAIDSEGIEDYVNSSGDKIKGLIADVGDTAIETGSKMHENWMKIDEAGGTTEKFRELKDVLDENGISVEELIENFDYLGFSLGDVNEKTIETSDNIQYLGESVNKSIEGLANLDSSFTTVYNAMNEFNNQGYISASTLQNLINNNLLQYFDVVNGKLSVNEAAMANAATAAKAKAIEDLQAQAAAQIAAIAFGEEGTAASAAAGTTSTMTTKTNNVKNALAQMTPEALKAADAWQKLNAAMGSSVEGLSEDQINRINTIMNNLSKSITAVNSVKIDSVSYRRVSAGSSGGSSSGSSSAAANAAKREAEQAAKAAQEAEEKAYKERLKKFKDYITERERLEKRWVDKQKDLGLLSNNDYLYITQQRIERYKKYLEEVRKSTWMNTEDRLELEKTYSEKIEDLQVDYLDYLNDKLKEQQDQIKKNYDERIDRIKDEATERINALKKVEDENDRIRAKEEYEKKRQEHLDDISYWEQRTGREAQEALKEARKNLAELDEEWQQQLEDWSIDDQIKAIEDERDAQIKATEEAQQAELNAIKAAYDEKVKRFAETGEIIYEGSVIQSKKLYNQYKTNFIDPISNDLKNLNKVETKTTTPVAKAPEQTSTQQQYETYLIKRGDTLSAIARRYGTTIEKIMAANPYVKNRNLIYAGKTLQIPKFHEGGIVGGNVEGFALLKPKEVILKPEWAEGINRLAKMARNKDNSITNNSTMVEVKGDLVHLDAKIDNRTDADYVVKKVEKVLKDKFNIKK